MNDPWHGLRRFTPARIALGRAGSSLPTAALLEFQLAHARARDAVHRVLDVDALAMRLSDLGQEVLRLESAAADVDVFIRYPDGGRVLCDADRRMLEARTPAVGCDVVFVLADGLSAQAIERHALPLLQDLLPRLADWRIGPLCLVRHGRVAIGDEIGALLGAAMSVVLIGERPGLSSPDSLGAYLTWQPLPGRSNAQRNCISNIRPEGLGHEAAAHKLAHLMRESRRRRLSGVGLKEDAPVLAPAATTHRIGER